MRDNQPLEPLDDISVDLNAIYAQNKSEGIMAAINALRKANSSTKAYSIKKELLGFLEKVDQVKIPESMAGDVIGALLSITEKYPSPLSKRALFVFQKILINPLNSPFHVIFRQAFRYNSKTLAQLCLRTLLEEKATKEIAKDFIIFFLNNFNESSVLDFTESIEVIEEINWEDARRKNIVFDSLIETIGEVKGDQSATQKDLNDALEFMSKMDEDLKSLQGFTAKKDQKIKEISEEFRFFREEMKERFSVSVREIRSENEKTQKQLEVNNSTLEQTKQRLLIESSNLKDWLETVQRQVFDKIENEVKGKLQKKLEKQKEKTKKIYGELEKHLEIRKGNEFAQMESIAKQTMENSGVMTRKGLQEAIEKFGKSLKIAIADHEQRLKMQEKNEIISKTILDLQKRVRELEETQKEKNQKPDEKNETGANGPELPLKDLEPKEVNGRDKIEEKDRAKEGKEGKWIDEKELEEKLELVFKSKEFMTLDNLSHVVEKLIPKNSLMSIERIRKNLEESLLKINKNFRQQKQCNEAFWESIQIMSRVGKEKKSIGKSKENEKMEELNENKGKGETVEREKKEGAVEMQEIKETVEVSQNKGELEGNEESNEMISIEEFKTRFEECQMEKDIEEISREDSSIALEMITKLAGSFKKLKGKNVKNKKKIKGIGEKLEDFKKKLEEINETAKRNKEATEKLTKNVDSLKTKRLVAQKKATVSKGGSNKASNDGGDQKEQRIGTKGTTKEANEREEVQKRKERETQRAIEPSGKETMEMEKSKEKMIKETEKKGKDEGEVRKEGGNEKKEKTKSSEKKKEKKKEDKTDKEGGNSENESKKEKKKKEKRQSDENEAKEKKKESRDKKEKKKEKAKEDEKMVQVENKEEKEEDSLSKEKKKKDKESEYHEKDDKGDVKEDMKDKGDVKEKKNDHEEDGEGQKKNDSKSKSSSEDDAQSENKDKKDKKKKEDQEKKEENSKEIPESKEPTLAHKEEIEEKQAANDEVIIQTEELQPKEAESIKLLTTDLDMSNPKKEENNQEEEDKHESERNESLKSNDPPIKKEEKELLGTLEPQLEPKQEESEKPALNQEEKQSEAHNPTEFSLEPKKDEETSKGLQENEKSPKESLKKQEETRQSRESMSRNSKESLRKELDAMETIKSVKSSGGPSLSRQNSRGSIQNQKDNEGTPARRVSRERKASQPENSSNIFRISHGKVVKDAANDS